jgi:hypothetical protein
MNSSTSKTSLSDYVRLDIHNSESIELWAAHLGISEWQLRNIIFLAGPSLTAICGFLIRNSLSKTAPEPTGIYHTEAPAANKGVPQQESKRKRLLQSAWDKIIQQTGK